ncbi:MAG: polysaccharide deacetylase family protein [Chitinophagaceae bacterium]
MKNLLIILFILLTNIYVQAQIVHKPIPDKLVVLSFDDGPVSHATFVAPLLKKYGFGATFFVCEFPPDFADKTKYMSWQQMKQLDEMGFEVANHTRNHVNLSKMDKRKFNEELGYIEDTCKALQIKTPLVSFAYPGYGTAPPALPVLKERGYLFARTGGNRAYDPEKDHPYLIPSFTMTDSNKAEIKGAFQLARNGKILVLTIHGVPDLPHPWVNTQPALFEEYVKFLYDNHFKVIALRELASYINVEKAMTEINPQF